MLKSPLGRKYAMPWLIIEGGQRLVSGQDYNFLSLLRVEYFVILPFTYNKLLSFLFEAMELSRHFHLIISKLVPALSTYFYWQLLSNLRVLLRVNLRQHLSYIVIFWLFILNWTGRNKVIFIVLLMAKRIP